MRNPAHANKELTADKMTEFAAPTRAERIAQTLNALFAPTALEVVDESAKQVSVAPLPASLSARECYQHSIAQGWKALDGTAREEVLQLAVALLSLP